MDFADNWNGSGNYKEKVSERTLQMDEHRHSNSHMYLDWTLEHEM